MLGTCILIENEREHGQSSVNGSVAEHEVTIVDRDGHKVENDDEQGLDYSYN